MKDDPPCPLIENEKQAMAIGEALHVVMHYTDSWALSVFRGSPPFTYRVGPDTLNEELRDLWACYTTIDERRRIATEFVKAMLT